MKAGSDRKNEIDLVKNFVKKYKELYKITQHLLKSHLHRFLNKTNLKRNRTKRSRMRNQG